MRSGAPAGRCGPFSRTQQRSRFSMPAASAATAGSGWSSGSPWRRAVRTGCGGARPGMRSGSGGAPSLAAARSSAGRRCWRGHRFDRRSRRLVGGRPLGAGCRRGRGVRSSGGASHVSGGRARRRRGRCGPLGRDGVGEAVEDRVACSSVMVSGGSRRTTAECRPPSSTISPRSRHCLLDGGGECGVAGRAPVASAAAVRVDEFDADHQAAAADVADAGVGRGEARWSRASMRAPSSPARSARPFSRT